MKSNISQGRINQQVRNMIKQNLSYLKALPLQDDMYTWHFTIQGPQNSDFHEGLYHGQILLPFEYPFKPPDMIFMNKNGRFQVNTKICLTITQYHPQQWNSAWTIRTMLQAIISLFNQNVQGIGYQQGSSEMRKSLAKKSHTYKCDKCGLLEDILKPRQPIKQEEKKVEESVQDMHKPLQKLQYASDLTFRKVKTEDNKNLSLIMPNELKNRSALQPNDLETMINDKQQIKKQSMKLNQQNKKANIPKRQQTYQLKSPNNDVISLNKKIQKNYKIMGNALCSMKITQLS